MYDIKRLKPIYPTDLIRLGRKRDGGYVVNQRALNAATVLLTFGISTDWSFEADWFKSRNHRPVYLEAYDYSVDLKSFLSRSLQSFRAVFSTKRKWKTFLFGLHFLRVAIKFKLFFQPPFKKFYRLGVSGTPQPGFINLDTVFSQMPIPPTANSVILKMDIEGAEYGIIQDILKFRSYLAMLIIEFHDLEENGPAMERAIQILEQMGYVITHVHPNNGGGVIPSTGLPKLLEMTFAKSSWFTKDELYGPNNRHYPIPGLDYPCISYLPELSMGFV
jgi:hypothetical protein